MAWRIVALSVGGVHSLVTRVHGGSGVVIFCYPEVMFVGLVTVLHQIVFNEYIVPEERVQGLLDGSVGPLHFFIPSSAHDAGRPSLEGTLAEIADMLGRAEFEPLCHTEMCSPLAVVIFLMSQSLKS